MKKSIYLFRPFVFVIVLLTLFCGCKSQQELTKSLNGIWLGEAYQYDVERSWDIYFVMDAKNQLYTIDYLSLGCGGKWILINTENNRLEFRELLNRGYSICTNNGKIILEIEDKHRVGFYYYWPDDLTLSAKGYLYKQ